MKSKYTSITFRCTKDQRKRMKRLAKVAKLTLADFIKFKTLNIKVIYHDVVKKCDNLITDRKGNKKLYQREYVTKRKEYIEMGE